MSWRKYVRNLKWLLPIFVLHTSSACCRAHVEPTCISAKPKLAPLPPETSRATRPDSTELLKRASTWSESSVELLDSVSTN